MSIHARNGCRDLLLDAFGWFTMNGRPLRGLRMVEFGNQRLKFDPDSGARRLQAAKPFMEFLGFQHTSIDTNGADGAVPYDLGKPLDGAAGLETRADLVTDFGTLEHVDSGPDCQRNAFRNAHNLCAPDGLMVHALPGVGTCRRHGSWKYSVDWFEQLAARNGYHIVKLEAWDKSNGWPERMNPGEQVYILAILRQRTRPFSDDWTDPVRE